ncbi:MAG: ChbG/HpnK family deacetylase [Syntrophobacteraceae bacterium]
MKRKLIVNADDFGLTPGVNAAVAECADLGMLRSATIMANAPAFEHGVNVARGRDHLGVGIHFVLTRLKPLSDRAKIPGLAGANGSLPDSPAALIQFCYSRRGARDEIRKELLAQAERVFDSGIVPTHFDSHKHVHMIPAVLDIMVEIARRYSVKWIRDPFEKPGAFRFLFDVEKGKRGAFLKQYAAALGAGPGRLYLRSRLQRAGIRGPDFFHGVAATGLLTEKLMKHLFESLKPGVNELMTHPGYLDADLEARKTRLLGSREKERELLASEDLARLLNKNGIVVSNFREVNL